MASGKTRHCKYHTTGMSVLDGDLNCPRRLFWALVAAGFFLQAQMILLYTT